MPAVNYGVKTMKKSLGCDPLLIPCVSCGVEHDHEELLGGFSTFTKDEINELNLLKILDKFPSILLNNECICNQCFNLEGKNDTNKTRKINGG